MENEKCLSTNQQAKIAIEEKIHKNVPQWKAFTSLPVHGILELVRAFWNTSFIIFLNIGGIGYYYLSLFLMAPILWNDYQLVWSHLRLCKISK